MSRGGIAANIAKLPERLLGLERPRSRLNCENPRMAVSGPDRLIFHRIYCGPASNLLAQSSLNVRAQRPYSTSTTREIGDE